MVSLSATDANSEKSGEVRRAFNELSLVAREIVPRLLKNNWYENRIEYGIQ